jgi:hypothetical protein
MNSLALEPHISDAVGVEVNDDSIVVNLSDGRTISAPLEWFPQLMQASKEEDETWDLSEAARVFAGTIWMKTFPSLP